MPTLQNSQSGGIFANNPLDDGPPMTPATLQASNFFPGAGGHTLYKVVVQYLDSSGLAVAPVAAGYTTVNGTPAFPPIPSDPGNPTIAYPGQIYQVQSPSMAKVAWWIARREDGNLPDIPDPQATDNEPYLKGWRIFAGAVLDEAGSDQRIFEIHGCYIYGVAQPRTASDGFYFPVPITDASGFGTFVLMKANVVTGVFGFGPAAPFPNTGIPDPAGAVNQNMPLGTEALFD